MAVWLSALPAAAENVDPAPFNPKNYKAHGRYLFKTWVNRLWPQAKARGVSRKTFDTAFQGVVPDWTLPDLIPGELGLAVPPARLRKNKRQAEFSSPGRYFPNGYISRQVRAGRKKRAKWAKTLNAIEQRFGVDQSAVLAIWGRETSYSRAKIPHDAIRSLATQAFMGRRRGFFNRELLMALQILQQGHVSRAKMKSSWAGAMGHTQFLPSHFMRHAVDFNGDGKKDIWGSIPDALASTANFLKKRDWQKGTPWFYEVVLPPRFDCTLQGADKSRAIAQWVGLGVKRTLGRRFPKHRLKSRGFILLPAGSTGPAFIALRNFQIFKAYNTSDLYALFVGHLADRYAKDRPFAGKWPKLRSYSRAAVQRMQQDLNTLGHRRGRPDGLVGWRSRVAVGKFQKAAGRPLTCYPSLADLNALAALAAKARAAAN
jgi:lytic murein transglycosylase